MNISIIINAYMYISSILKFYDGNIEQKWALLKWSVCIKFCHFIILPKVMIKLR